MFPSRTSFMLTAGFLLHAILVASAMADPWPDSLVPRGDDNTPVIAARAIGGRGEINQPEGMAGFAYHQSVLVGTTIYIDGGTFHDTDRESVLLPNIWLRVLDTSKKFQIDAMDQVPIKFRKHAVGAQEVSGGDLWAYKGTIYQPAGSLGSNFSMEKFEIKTKTWSSMEIKAPVKRIGYYAQSLMVESVEKAFVINGEYADDGKPVDRSMLIYDFKTQTWQNETTPWTAWSHGLAHHIPLDDSGYIVGFAGNGRKDGRMDQIEVYDIAQNLWRKTQPATPFSSFDGIPVPRQSACSVIARAKDGSSYNIYMFGGRNSLLDSTRIDAWVLSIPSFTWIQVKLPSIVISGVPEAYEGATCHIVGGGRQMLLYGGRVVNKLNRYDRIGIHVFDLTKLRWEVDYEPDSGEYEVPKLIYNVIGGGPQGGATLLPAGGMANPEMQEKFLASLSNSNSTVNATDPGTGATDAGSTASKGLGVGAIAGIVVGVLLAVLAVVGQILYRRRRSKSDRMPGDNSMSELAVKDQHELYDPQGYSQELPGCAQPHELAAYQPPASELAAYQSPSEFGAYQPHNSAAYERHELESMVPYQSGLHRESYGDKPSVNQPRNSTEVPVKGHAGDFYR